MQIICRIAGALILWANFLAAQNFATARISGAVVGRDGRPLGKALIALRPETNPNDSPYSVRADDLGRYTIDEIAPQRYLIHVTLAGYSATDSPLGLAAGEDRNVDITMTRNGGISGRVIDTNDRPIAGVRVSAYRNPNSAARTTMLPFGNATTGPDGQFTIAGLMSGKYVVRVDPLFRPRVGKEIEPGKSAPREELRRTWFPNAASVDGAAFVDVEVETIAGGIVIRAPYLRTVEVQGSIRTGDGSPLPALALSLTDTVFDLVSVALPKVATVRPDGSFRFQGVIPGTYLLAPSRNPASAASAGENVRWGGSATLSVGTDGLRDIVLTVRRNPTVTGLVTFEGTAPEDPGKISVWLEYMDRTTFDSPRATGEPGVPFAFRAVPPGRYWVRISGFPDSAYLKSLTFLGAPITGGLLDLGAGMAGEIRVVLSDRAISLVGSIRSADDKRVRGLVVAWPEEGDPLDLGSRPISAMTATSGAFQVHSLAPARYRFIAVESGSSEAFQDPEFRRRLVGYSTAVDLRNGQSMPVTLKALTAADFARIAGNW